MDEDVKVILKNTCKPGIKSDKDYNQILMLTALMKIKRAIIKGVGPSNVVVAECSQINETILDIIENTLEVLTPIYD